MIKFPATLIEKLFMAIDKGDIGFLPAETRNELLQARSENDNDKVESLKQNIKNKLIQGFDMLPAEIKIILLESMAKNDVKTIKDVPIFS